MQNGQSQGTYARSDNSKGIRGKMKLRQMAVQSRSAGMRQMYEARNTL